MLYQDEIDNVSRETFEDIKLFREELFRWNKSINLISGDDEVVFFERHVLPNVLLYQLIGNDTDEIVDIGSGGGLPGIVFAILRKQDTSPDFVTLIESDQRKCVFLEEISRKLHLKTRVICKRIEEISSHKTRILTARALSPLVKLVEYSRNLLVSGGSGFFIKGRLYQEEINVAREKFNFEYTVMPLIGESVVVKVQRIQDAHR